MMAGNSHNNGDPSMVLTLMLNHPINRWANIIAALFFLL
jgi:hypothetical protein